MSIEATIGIAAVVAMIVFVAWLFTRKKRSEHLQSRFGPEYDRVVQEHGNRHRAEAALEKREQRLSKIQLHPLALSDRDRFIRAWRSVQARFVDDPSGALAEADRLVNEVMQARGYPVEAADLRQRAEDISVDHPHLVENYRAAAEIARPDDPREITTEDRRRAMVYYRSLFDDLLEVQEVRQ
jgi:hypothetical protein